MLSTTRERTGSVDASAPINVLRVGLLEAVGAVHIREVTVRDVLQTARNARRLVLLRIRHVDDLGQFLRHEPHQVRSRIFLAEEAGLE